MSVKRLTRWYIDSTPDRVRVRRAVMFIDGGALWCRVRLEPGGWLKCRTDDPAFMSKREADRRAALMALQRVPT